MWFVVKDLPLGGILLTSGAEPSTGEVVIWKYHCTRENYLKYGGKVGLIHHNISTCEVSYLSSTEEVVVRKYDCTHEIIGNIVGR